MEQQYQNFPPPISEEQEIKKVDYVEKTPTTQNKYLIFLIIVFIVAFTVVLFKGFNNKNTGNVKIEGNNVTINLGKQYITAEMAVKSIESFLLNSGEMPFSNEGDFNVIPMEKVKSLEQKYTDFIHCGSPGEEEGKNSLIYIGFIAANSVAKGEMKNVNNLVQKGNLVVIEITGSKLENIKGLKEDVSGFGPIVVSPVKPEIYYLVDDIKIINEKYQK